MGEEQAVLQGGDLQRGEHARQRGSDFPEEGRMRGRQHWTGRKPAASNDCSSRSTPAAQTQSAEPVHTQKWAGLNVSKYKESLKKLKNALKLINLKSRKKQRQE